MRRSSGPFDSAIITEGYDKLDSGRDGTQGCRELTLTYSKPTGIQEEFTMTDKDFTEVTVKEASHEDAGRGIARVSIEIMKKPAWFPGM